MIFIYGTASSGKSNIAEGLAVESSRENGTKLIYMATMENKSQASKERIRRHRLAREGKGFYTIEEPFRPVTHVTSVSGKTVLLECVSNLCANVYFDRFGDKVATLEEIEEMAEDISTQIIKLADSAASLYVVSNNVFEDGIIYDEWTESYLVLLATVNTALAKESDEFIEVLNGIKVVRKRAE